LYSAYSNTASALTASSLAAPSNLTATALSGGRAQLNWTSNSTGEAGFRIERRLGTGAFREVGAVGTGVSSFLDSGLAGGSIYSYRVRAYAGTVYSAYSNTAVMTAVKKPRPIKPTRKSKSKRKTTSK
jgi:hypothetical protein